MHHALKYNNINICCERNFSSEGETTVFVVETVLYLFMVNWFVIRELNCEQK